ncbi:MAG: alpha/beta fold hydrolase [Patescibacteria group bacterium]|jgi:dienelactone hydrolase
MQKRVVFKSKVGQKLVGIFDIPKGKPPFPAVIICHGFKGYKEQMHLKSLASLLAKKGILAFRFDFGNGAGQSYGKLEDIMFSQYLRDLKTAVDYLSHNKLVDKKRIGLAGHSLGGQLILHYAPIDKRITVLADLAGVVFRGAGKTNLEKNTKEQLAEAKKTGYFFVYSKRTGKKYRIKVGYYFELLKYNTPERIKKIKIPILIIHGSKDESVALSHPYLAYKLLKSTKKLVIIKGAPHTWRGKNDPGNKFQKKINPIVVEWFKKYL